MATAAAEEGNGAYPEVSSLMIYSSMVVVYGSLRNLNRWLVLSQMIMEAIAELGEGGGADKAAISNYIESKQKDLPPDHSSLLATHLDRMKENGELLLVDGNYTKPASSTLAKRGRGRPPKPKPELAAGAEVPSPRPRGRPPKPKDPLADAVAKVASGFPRPRGRPPKADRAADSGTSAAVVGVKRGRGRPPKVKPALVAEAV
ncbi:hypothetical protein ZIOFF_068903 [Zingiber officinale]|uniref:H15 domain-containing protein n=1 Tax=Zingiber officinale TaxID=94328 RepID=A0A8J5CVH5_ZINOF|nr:hypothetical protein ZIOFF_068903 [Zingiber officinale]